MKQQINGNNPIRVLHMAPIRMGGITELVLTLSEKIDFEKVQFDYLTFEDTFDQASKRAKEAHSTIYRVDLQTVKNPIVRGLKKFFGIIKLVHSEQIKIIHINSSTPFQSWQSLLTVIVTLNLSQGVFNNGMLEFKENRNQFQFALVVITAVCTGLFFLIFEIFKTPLLNMFEIPPVMVYVMVLYFLFVPAYQFWSGRQRYEYKYKALSIITVCIGLFSLLLGVLFVLNASSENEAIARVCAMEGVNIVVGIFFFMIIAMKAQFKLRIDYCIYALKFNIPLIPHYMSMYMHCYCVLWNV